MKHVSFITEGPACQAEISAHVGRCLGEKHGRKDAVKEETRV